MIIIFVGEKDIYQISVNDYPMAMQLDQTINMAHRDKMKEDLGTLINHKIRLDGTLDTNIFKILFAIITAMTRLKIIFVVGSSWQFRLGGRPTASGRCPTFYSIKQIQTTEDV